MIKTNKFQTQLTEELQKELPKQIWGQLIEYIESVKFIQNLIAPEEVRGFAKDKPKMLRDDGTPHPDGRIQVDIHNPHILEDMDFFRERALYFKEYGVYTHIPRNANPKSEYAKFWQEELRRWKYGLVRPSDGEWIPGSLYFYWNYSQIWLVEKAKDAQGKIIKKKGERKHDFPRVYLGDYLFYHYCDQAQNLGKHGKMLKARGVGAEQPHSEIVKTFQGDRTVGDIKTGDKLIGIDGKETTVLEIYPQGKKDVYEVELIDGRKIRCGIDHLWYVKDFSKKDKKTPKAVKLSEMIEKGLYWNVNEGKNKAYKYKIPKQSPIEYSKKELPIDPYVLGLLIGDGTLTTKSIKIATEDTFIIEEIERILPDYDLNKDTTNCNYIFVDKNRFNVKSEELEKYKNAQYGLNRLKREIELLGLNVKCFDKFIPEIYKMGNIEQRFSLLQGLMDSDGSVNTEGNKEFSNSNLKLIQDVADLVRSLGMKCRISKGRVERKKDFKGREINCKQEYRLHIITNEVIFRLPRKAKRCKVRQIFEDCAIVNIKKLDYQEESSCFLVDNETHTYLTTDFTPTHNSFKFASMSPRNMYVLPGSGNPNFHLASEKTFLLGDKGIWGKILDNLDWIGDHTPLPKMRLFDRKNDMEIQLGVEDEYGKRLGLLSSVYGVSLKDNPDKARGIRGPLIHYEEDGLFPNLEKAWNVNREATEEDGIAYGFMFAAGTGGTEGASFEGSEKLFYQCDAYNIYGIPNVFDKNTDGSTTCGFFWGAYLNRGEDVTKENGEPDVIGSLIKILLVRKQVADASNDPKAITQKKAESPITPQEAVMRTEGTVFPVSDLKDYLGEIMPNLQSFIASHYVGELVLGDNNEVKYKPNADIYIIREYPLQDNLKKEGGVEIFEMPKTGLNGLIPKYRYVAGIDPYDDDHSTTTSLGSMFLFDLFTDRIVAEYTGRPLLANLFYENCLRLLKLYNAVALYENDKKGLFTYFSNKNELHYLADTPQILKDMDIVKATNLFGNKAKGFNSGKIVNAWGRRLQADWMLSPAYGEEAKINLHKIRSIGYLKEAIGWNIDGNFDRISAMTPVMILREEYYKYVLQAQKNNQEKEIKSLSNDDFFKLNYDMRGKMTKQVELLVSSKSYNNLSEI